MSNVDRDRYLILAGTNKSGTTAIFRYLGDHPGVSVSRYKESRYFYKHSDDMDAGAIRRYRDQFLSHDENGTVFVEASPTYLHGGREVARRIKRVIPNCKLLFSLRNPTSRVVSYYRSSFGQPHVATYGVAFEEFVARAIDATHKSGAELDSIPFEDREFRQELTMSRYANFLREFMEEFASDQVRICFFDSLTTNAGYLMKEICKFVGIDPAFYDEYEFRVENQTRLHRHAGLRFVAGRTNYLLEPFLNRFPWVRRVARQMYDLVNVDQAADISVPVEAVSALDRFFAPANSQLAELMASYYPDQPLPDWVQ